MPSSINFSDLHQAAVQYDPILRYLPHVLLEPFISEMHFNLQNVAMEDRRINMRRKGALLRPYKGTVTKVNEQELLKPEESVLTPRNGYLALVDNIQNYREKVLVMRGGKTVDNRTKEHPYQREILENVVRTFVEDFTLAIPHAKYNTATDSPLGVFDGYNAIIDGLITGTQISEANGNLVKCDEIKAPTGAGADPIKPLTTLVGWLRGLNPMLKAGELDLHLPSNILEVVLDAFEAKRAYQGDTSREKLALYLRDKAGLTATPTIISNPIMGTGTRMLATRPGNITVGISAPADLQFVQVRSVDPDPNVVQFWMQADMGTRLDDWNKKVFATNGGTIKSGVGLNGDYVA